MAFNPRGYETVYGFGVLDELHNFFPEIMYDDSIFRNDIMNYMRHRMNTLFPAVFLRQQNLYRIYHSQERAALVNQWRRSHVTPIIVPSPAPVPAPTQTPSRAVAASSVPVTPVTARNVVVTPTAPVRRRQNPIADPMEDLLTSLLTTAVASNRRGVTSRELPLWDSTTLLNGFMAGNPILAAWQDVIVTPTPEQIAAGSEIVEHASVPVDTACAVCIEHGESQQWRKLHCSHMFHKSCIDTWFQQTTHCPVCRADIRESEENNESDTEDTEDATTSSA